MPSQQGNASVSSPPFGRREPEEVVDFAALRASHEHGLLDDAQLGLFLSRLSSRCSTIFRYFSLGLSTEGRQMWAARLTDNPDVAEDEPEFLYIGNIHGDETFGRELLIHMVLDICDKYAAGDAGVRSLVDETDIYVVFSANPDGFQRLTRYNANGVDLNRNYPDQVTMSVAPQQRETSNLMAFLKKHTFSLGANLHSGTLVCNYPWDDVSSGRLSTKVPSYAPDEALYHELCLTYSRAHGYMYKSTKFPEGVTNGAEFYSMFGGLQDYAYSQLGMLHVTLELGYEKNPPLSRLHYDWVSNSRAMYAFMGQARLGLRGRVTCSCGGPLAGGKGSSSAASRRPATDGTLSFRPEVAAATVPAAPPLAQTIYTRTRPDIGSYHRVLLPGTYFVDVKGCGGVVLEAQRVVVPSQPNGSAAGLAAIEVDFNLHQFACPVQTQVKAELHPVALGPATPSTAATSSAGGRWAVASSLLVCTAPGATLALLGALVLAACVVERRRRRRRFMSTAYTAVDGDLGGRLAVEE